MPTPAKSALPANEILNQVAAESGIQPVADPFGSVDPTFVQLRYLLNAAGDELVTMHPWQYLQTEHSFTTPSVDAPEDYALPDDFAHIIDQTGWERNENVPLFGPASPQDWQYMYGRDLVSSTIYATFRLAEGVMKIFPSNQTNLDIHYEYISLNWVRDADDPTLFKNRAEKGGDTPVYPRQVLMRYLKLKYRDAKGLDTTNAQADFNQQFLFATGQDMSGKVLNAGGGRRGFPYLDGFYNTPSTGYGGGSG